MIGTFIERHAGIEGETVLMIRRRSRRSQICLEDTYQVQHDPSLVGVIRRDYYDRDFK